MIAMARSRWAAPARGFSLLELLVVLTIGGLMVAMVGPNVIGQLDRASRQFEFEQFRDDLSQLPRLARVKGVRLVLTQLPLPVAKEGGAPPATDASKPEPVPALITLPPGWFVRFDPPLIITANGVCSESNLEVHFPGEAGVDTAAHFLIRPFTCEVLARAES